MNHALALPRLWYLLRGDFITGYRSLLVSSAGLAALILVVAMIAPSDYHGFSSFHRTAFTIVLFTWGIVATSRAFGSLHDKTRNEGYLLLPASALEKTLARLLTVTVGFVAYLLVFCAVVSVVVESLNLLFFGNRHRFFDPFDPIVWERISLYVVVQALYFLGAAWFRRGHFMKTTLAITLGFIALATLTLVALRIAFADLWAVAWDIDYALESLHDWFASTGSGFLFAVKLLLPIACWCIAWLRVAETQVSDGV